MTPEIFNPLPAQLREMRSTHQRSGAAQVPAPSTITGNGRDCDMTQQIPLVDLSLQTAEVELEVTEGIAEVIRSGAYVLGPQVVEFESAYAAFCGVPHCVGVGNGTDAIE